MIAEAIDCPNCGRLLDPFEPSCHRCQPPKRRPALEVPAWLSDPCCFAFIHNGKTDHGITELIEREAIRGSELHVSTWVAREVIARADRLGVTVADQVRRMVATCVSE